MNTSVRFTGSEGAKDATPPAFTAQLNSGTRAFDARPYLDGANLVFHHGVVVVHTALTDAFAEVFKWASLPENHGELVVLYMNKCEGGAGCWDRTFEVLNKNNITWAHPDGQCFQKNMTYEAALRLGRNPTIGTHDAPTPLRSLRTCRGKLTDPTRPRPQFPPCRRRRVGAGGGRAMHAREL